MKVNVLLFLALVMGLCSCSYINSKIGLQDDNLGEEAVEEVVDAVIEHETGIDMQIDLTPDSPEEK